MSNPVLSRFYAAQRIFMIFDTHAHYDDGRFDEDREEVLASLSQYGVGAVCNIGSDLESSRNSVELAGKHRFMYAAVGVHPESVADMTEEDLEELRQMVLRERLEIGKAKENIAAGVEVLKIPEKKIVAIGEIGLDYYWQEVPHELQKKWFIRQLELSEELALPVVIHSRDAAKDSYDILKEYKTGENAGIMHCFGYSKEMARQFLDLGYMIGLGGVVTFKNGRVAKEVASFVPLDRLVLETDCPYMAPHPHRGERNFSGFLPLVVREIAAIKGISEEELIAVTEENARRIYAIN